jgi:hypothetical protein
MRRHITLEPATSSSPARRPTPGPWHPGDVVAVEIDGIGRLENTVVEAEREPKSGVGYQPEVTAATLHVALAVPRRRGRGSRRGRENLSVAAPGPAGPSGDDARPGLADAALELVGSWEASFGPVAAHPALATDPARLDAAWSEFAARMGGNYPSSIRASRGRCSSRRIPSRWRPTWRRCA